MKNKFAAIAFIALSANAIGSEQAFDLKSTICLKESFNQLSCGIVGNVEHEVLMLAAEKCPAGFEVLKTKVQRSQADNDLYLHTTVKCLQSEATPEKPRTE